jgi:arylsulfatase A-like enzyme
MTRPPLLPLALSLLAAACGGDGAGVEGPNVLLITLDTTRADHIACYGGSAHTPVLDRIAREGARFERAISTAGITPMSHSSILTGLNNYRHGMRVFHSELVSHRLKDSVDTLPELLKRRGYATAATVSGYPVSAAYGLDQGFDYFSTGAVDAAGLDLSRQQRHEANFDTSGISATQRRGDRTVSDALEWLADRGEDGAWCLWVHLFDVHDTSLVPPVEFVREHGILEYPSPDTPAAGPIGNQWRERMYDPELAYMDQQIGRLVAWLEGAGEWENTIVVITADHGQGLTDGLRRHGWVKHRLIYDWCIRVPLLIRLPGGKHAGVVVGEQVRTIDVLPTVLEALDIGAPEVEGASLLALMRGEREPAPRMAYADALNALDAHSPGKKLPPGQDDNLFCATDGVWKFVLHKNQPASSELYHLAQDPLEAHNLYAPDHPEVARLGAWLRERRVDHLEPPGAEIMTPEQLAEHKAKLEASGYVGGGDEDEDGY